MRKKMLLSYAVPVMLICGIVFICGAFIILSKIQEQARSNTEKTTEQAESYISFYLQNMEYVMDLLKQDADLTEILSNPDFGLKQGDQEWYLEFYQLSQIFAFMEISNEEFRVGMYVPDEAIYAENDYYFYPISSLTQRDDYEIIDRTLSLGVNTFVVMQDKEGGTTSSTQDYLALLNTMSVECTDGVTRDYVIKVEIKLSVLRKILQNASLIQNSVLYMIDQNGQYLFSSDAAESFRTVSDLPSGTSGNWEKVTISGKQYFVLCQDGSQSSWKLLALISSEGFYQQFSWFFLWFVIIISCILVSVAAASYILSRYYANRIGALNAKMDEVQKGNLLTHTENLPRQESRDELDMLDGNFDMMISEVRELMKEQYRLGRSVSQAEMKALQAQINPHFLYNTLDLINWGAQDYGADDVAKLARNLGQLYRLSLNHGRSAISIEDELRHVQAYLNIENVHYNDTIFLTVDIPDEIRSYACLNITLQPFVENSVLHGMGEHSEIKSCAITISAWQEEDDIVFSVKDDGPGIDPVVAKKLVETKPGEGSNGYGIGNVNFRIKLTYGEEYGITYVTDGQNTGTDARIRIKAMHLDELEALSKQ